MSILVKIFKMSILVKIDENFDVKIFEKCRLGSKLTKLLILDKTEDNADFSEIFKKTLILVKSFENLDLVKIIEKSWFGSKC